MSHFTVLVIGDDPETQLAPFQENNMGDCPEEYLVFNNIEEEQQKEYLEGTERRFVSPDGADYSPYDNIFKITSENGSSRYELPDGYSEKQIPNKDIYPTFDEFMIDQGEERNKENGLYGYFENPNAKWDWYQLGGRWSGSFLVKEGSTSGVIGQKSWMDMSELPENHVDQALIKEIDFDKMRQQAEDHASKKYESVASLFENNLIPRLQFLWEDLVKDQSFKDYDERRNKYHSQPEIILRDEILKNLDKEKLMDIGFFDIDDFQCTKEEYCERARNNIISSFAVLKDGQWYEKGQMGMFAMISNKKDEDEWNGELRSLLEDLPEDTLISMYDCHI